MVSVIQMVTMKLKESKYLLTGLASKLLGLNVNPAGSVALTPGLHSSLWCLPSVAVTLLVTDGGQQTCLGLPSPVSYV